jgi:hypothetical protein
MSRTRIVAEDYSNQDVSEKLLQHREERDRLLSGLTKFLEQDERVRAAWLWGSFMRGEQDDLSDIDLWTLIAPGFESEMGSSFDRYVRSIGPVVSAGENAHNGPPGGGYLGALVAGAQGLHHLDLYWQPVANGELPDAPILIDRVNEPAPVAPQRTIPIVEPEPETELGKCVRRISFVWLMLSVTAKYLARDGCSDMKLLTYPRPSFEETASALGLEDRIGEVRWEAGAGVDDKLNMLRNLALKTKILEDGCRERGLDISSSAHGCLMGYFHLVEAVLKP